MNALALTDTRLPMPEQATEAYDMTPEKWRVLVNAIFPLAKTTEGVLMALGYCEQRGLDPFRKCVHLVPMKVTKKRSDGSTYDEEIETVWPGIGELRITAQRQADFFGWDDCEFGPDIEFSGKAKVQVWKDGRKNGWSDVQWRGPVPEWAQFTVYKRLHGERVQLKGPRVYFLETYSPVGRFNPCPNDRWQRSPRQMIEKCAEAAALRRAWPDVFGDEASYEEMEGKTIFSGNASGIMSQNMSSNEEGKPEGEAKAKPTRADFKETVEDAEFDPVDETAENSQMVADNTAQPETLSLPDSRAKWEIWHDNFNDKLADRVEQENGAGVRSLVQKNLPRIEAAPEDIRDAINQAVNEAIGQPAVAPTEEKAATSTGEDDQRQEQEQ